MAIGVGDMPDQSHSVHVGERANENVSAALNHAVLDGLHTVAAGLHAVSHGLHEVSSGVSHAAIAVSGEVSKATHNLKEGLESAPTDVVHFMKLDEEPIDSFLKPRIRVSRKSYLYYRTFLVLYWTGDIICKVTTPSNSQSTSVLGWCIASFVESFYIDAGCDFYPDSPRAKGLFPTSVFTVLLLLTTGFDQLEKKTV